MKGFTDTQEAVRNIPPGMRNYAAAILLLALLSPASALRGQIIADHRVVDQYQDIPQQYIDSVKKMLVFMAGESHSGAYRVGPELLELLDPAYQAETYTTDPPPVDTDQFLRIGRPFMVGESSFFSSSDIEDLKSHITTQAQSGNPYDVMGFGWCWDMTWTNPPGGGMDPVYHVRWAGSSQGGPDGNQRWGLDAGDSVLTGNRVCMDTYLEAVEEYIAYCKANGYPTRWVFTTGPVDGSSNNGTEQGFQRELKHDYIRDYVNADPSRILFDYADILCWNNAGEQYLAAWEDGDSIRTHMQIHPDNQMDYDGSWNEVPFTDEDQDHIGEVGALRLAKAMWWMLARMAGWESAVMVREIQVTSRDGITEIVTGDTLRFEARVIPQDATNPQVAWSVTEGSGSGTISEDGLLTGVSPGTLTVVASATDGSGVSGSFGLTITEPAGLVDPGKGRLSLWPNPGSAHFYLHVSDLEVMQIQVMSIDGKIVRTRTPEAGKEILELDLGGQPPGLYMVLIHAAEGSFSRKLVLTQ